MAKVKTINGYEIADETARTNASSALSKANENENKIDDEIETREQQISVLQSSIQGLASGSPKGAYSTTSDLVLDNPDTGVYVVTNDGHVYSWTKDSSQNPIDLGLYQAAQIITDKELEEINEPADANITGQEINSILSELRTGKANYIFPNWENGSILSNGADANSTQTTYPYSIRTVGYKKVSIGKATVKPNGFYVMIFKYSDNSSHTLISHTQWITTDTEYTFDNDGVYRITIYDYVDKNNSSLYWKDIVNIVYKPSTYLTENLEAKHTILDEILK